MNASFVVDCSVAMTWLFEEEATKLTAELLDRLKAEDAVVPDLWFIEIANVVALAERKGRITLTQSTEFVRHLLLLGIEVDAEAHTRAFDQLLPLCRAHRLTSYDATYLDLAIRRQLPLATLDKSLREAAVTMGLSLLGI